MSDTTGSNSVSCCNVPDSSSQDDYYHHQHLQPEPAAERPEYSQQPIDGRDTRLELATSPAAPSQPPPNYVHPPPYAVDYTPGRGGVSEVRIHEVPDSHVRRETSKSYLSCIILACVVFWLCGCVFGAVAFILAELAGRKSTSQAKRLADASFTVSAVGILIGIILLTFVLTGTDWVVDNNWKTTDLGSANATFCHVVDNDTTCFRFASSFTAEQCSAVDGVIVNISSSTPAPSPAATLTSTLCYHDDCEEDSFIVDTSCFHHRATNVDSGECPYYNGYSVEDSLCYY